MDEQTVKTRWGWFRRLTLRQKLLLAIAVSLGLHFLLLGGAVLPEKIAEYRQWRQEQARLAGLQHLAEQTKLVKAAEKQQLKEASRQTIQAKLKEDFNNIVAGEMRQDHSDQLWD